MLNESCSNVFCNYSDTKWYKKDHENSEVHILEEKKLLVFFETVESTQIIPKYISSVE